MRKVLLLWSVLVVLDIPSSTAFTAVPGCRTGNIQTFLAGRSRSTALAAIAVEDLQDFGYSVAVKKPLGVIFGENRDPYLGLRVDDVELESEGSRAGLRVGDQLLAVNADVTIGQSFDSAMAVLQASPGKMKLMLYRGPVRDLYTILMNRDLQLDGDEGEEEVIMDENYVSPVVVEFTEDPGFDVMKALAKLTGGGGGGAKNKSGDDQQPEPPKQAKKKGGGLFGMFGESIQLEGDDATGIQKKG